MTTHPHPHERTLSAEMPQLPGREAPADRVPVSVSEERIAREPAEQADGRARDPVTLHVGHDDGRGGQAPLFQANHAYGFTEDVKRAAGSVNPRMRLAS
jgi:hypothetical protein